MVGSVVVVIAVMCVAVAAVVVVGGQERQRVRRRDVEDLRVRLDLAEELIESLVDKAYEVREVEPVLAPHVIARVQDYRRSSRNRGR